MFYCIILFLFASGCLSVRSSTHRWWVSQCTTTTSCCSTHWTNPSLCSSAWSPLRSAPNPSVSSGTTPFCECNNTETELMKKLMKLCYSHTVLLSLLFTSVLVTAAGQQRAARWFLETAPTSAVSVITWRALLCSWISPGEKWVIPNLFIISQTTESWLISLIQPFFS